ncbi:ABC transporter permease [Amycolatopsis cihanbeyliensis]|uniref:Peptide/nickel transport system permease protein n=1 Tax=Amycolatopsis cihanbeyliensis TaxID=1128664 RepID=A0A542DID7_AMYCI|nr:ABC transporter permease [Amycolatopsis cihanbeyliensis]TQJ02774.1 peptide/nickel transport system permease protein [Amycolatopsis cihanbeyliensis]
MGGSLIVAGRGRGELGGFVLRRLAAVLPVLLAALTLSFAMIHLVPGDPVRTMLGAGGPPTLEQEQALRHELGLDRPIPAQYLDFLGNAVLGDFGRSINTGAPVADLIGAAAPGSAALAVTALALGCLLGAGGALLAEITRWRPLRTVLNALPVLAMSMPGYWVAILMIQIFSFQLGWFPATGQDGFAALVLPAATMALPAAGVIAQVLATGLRQAGAESYVLTARSKGAGPWRVQFRHTLRNASLPTITVVGTTVGNLLAAAVVAETVFGRQGLGRLTVTAITTHDLPVLQGMVALLGVLYVAVNLVVDVVYAYVDPRVTSGRRE